MFNDILGLILSCLASLIALTVHEYCHGYAAYKLGDDTAKNFGRLTLNPIKHIDIYGFICMALFHVGWAKPVPINARNFKDPKKGFAITAAAGPASNLILGLFTTPIVLLLINSIIVSGGSGFSLNLSSTAFSFFYVFHLINIGLGVFNLLPVPPFDGSRLLYVFLPPKAYFAVMKYERKIYIAVLCWLLLGNYAAAGVRMIPFVQQSEFLYWFAGIFSLSNMIGTAIQWVSTLMIRLWGLIPPLKSASILFEYIMYR